MGVSWAWGCLSTGKGFDMGETCNPGSRLVWGGDHTWILRAVLGCSFIGLTAERFGGHLGVSIRSHAWCCTAQCAWERGAGQWGPKGVPKALAQCLDSGPEQDWVLPADGSSIKGDTGDSATCSSTPALRKQAAPLASLSLHPYITYPFPSPSSFRLLQPWFLPRGWVPFALWSTALFLGWEPNTPVFSQFLGASS